MYSFPVSLDIGPSPRASFASRCTDVSSAAFVDYFFFGSSGLSFDGLFEDGAAYTVRTAGASYFVGYLSQLFPTFASATDLGEADESSRSVETRTATRGCADQQHEVASRTKELDTPGRGVGRL